MNYPQSPLLGKLFLSALGLSIAAIGALFVYLLGSSYSRAKAMRHWEKLPCTIKEIDIRHRQVDINFPKEYQLSLTYTYSYQNHFYQSNQLSLRGNPWRSEPKKVETIIHDLKAAKPLYCWVNPQDPNVAVLQLDTLAPGYSIWFPGLFVVGGLGIIVNVWLPKRKPK